MQNYLFVIMLFVFVVSLACCFYLLARNIWTKKILTEQINKIHKLNVQAILNGDPERLDYSDLPEYEYILLKKFWIWNKGFFFGAESGQ